MPATKFIKKNQEMSNHLSFDNADDSLNGSNRIGIKENSFVIEFNEDGTPIDCHKVNI